MAFMLLTVKKTLKKETTTMTTCPKLLFTDQNEDFRKIFNLYFTRKGYDVIECLPDGKSVLSAILENSPQIAVIDLFMQGYDGLYILRELSKSENTCKIIISSNTPSPMLQTQAIECGATHFLIKPFDLDALYDQIEYLIRPAQTLTEESASFDEEIVITEMLHQIGVPPHIKGYNYVRDAILMSLDDRNLINHVTKELYPVVAKQNDTTPTRVERAIRHAIETAWDRGDVDVLNSFFGYTIHNQRGKPTNSEFIAMITDKVRLEKKRCYKQAQ